MNISTELALVLNLRNVAVDHKEYCGHNCNVSLGQLKQAAILIRDKMVAMNLHHEVKEANRYISEMPIS